MYRDILFNLGNTKADILYFRTLSSQKSKAFSRI